MYEECLLCPLYPLLFNVAKDLLIFSTSPLSRSRKIEFSLNTAYRGIVWYHPNHIGTFEKNVKYGRFSHNNGKFYLFFFFYVDHSNFATADLI